MKHVSFKALPTFVIRHEVSLDFSKATRKIQLKIFSYTKVCAIIFSIQLTINILGKFIKSFILIINLPRCP